jgi:GNAT superfamily N-acetyltransferase
VLAARDAKREDYAAFVRLFLELRVPDPTPAWEAWDEKIAPHTFFLWDGGVPVAYVFWQKIGELARVMHVVVAPEARGRGLGRELMRETAARAKRAGCTRWMLNVRPDNVPALRLYEAFGLRRGESWWSLYIEWADVAKLPDGAGEGATEAFVVTPEEDAGVEREAKLPAGQIGVLRAGGGRVLIGLRQGEAILGFAAFDPSFPGAWPFLAQEAWVVRRLLEAMRPHALEGKTNVRFGAHVEKVRDAAIAAGAVVAVAIVKMEGEVP